MSYDPKAAQYKKDTIQEFADLINSYPIVGVVDLESLPAKQEQTIRAKLRDNVVIRMTKKTLMERAFAQAKDKPGVEQLREYFRGMPALLFTKENPFSLFRTIKQNQSPAPAKAGQTAPKDIVIPAGPTPFAPGPVIGELGAIGVKTKVEGGKIAITDDAVVAKEGEVISEALAGMLQRLDIMPMSVGLDLVAVWEEGDILTRSVLDIDEEQFLEDLTTAARWAFNLSVEATYPTADNSELLVQKAFREAKALALEAEVLADAVVEDMVSKAAAHASALATKVDLENPKEQKEAPASQESSS